jgi:hypothetical protein
MQKPTGKPGEQTDRIFRCIEIERCIQDAANAAMLGVSLGESLHSRDDDSYDLEEEEDGSGHGEDIHPPLVNDVQFNNDNPEEAGNSNDEDAEVAAASGNVNVSNEGAVLPRPQSLPVFGSGGDARARSVPSSATCRGVTTINNGAVLRRSPLSILNSSGWGRDKKS